MKKRFLALGLVLTMSMTSLCGCGKDDDSDKHHKGRDKETSSHDDSDSEDENDEFFKDSIFGKDNKDQSDDSDDDYDDADDEEDEEDDDYSSTTGDIEPSQEILKADFTDFKFQIEDSVVTLKSGDTVEEFVNQLSDNFYLYDTYEGKVATSRLVDGEEYDYLTLFWDDGDRSSKVMYLDVRNMSDDDCELKDCIITDFEFNDYDGRNIYFAKGIPLSTPADDRFSYDNIKDTLEDLGVEESDDDLYYGYGVDVSDYAGRVVLDESSDSFNYCIYVFGEDPCSYDSEAYPAYRIEISIDKNTREGTCEKSSGFEYSGS